MPRSKWSVLRRRVGGALSVALGTGLVGISLVPAAGAQEPLPKLPATKVEGQPTPGTPTQPLPPTDPFPNDFPPSPTANPVSQGGIFGSPPADGYNAPSATTGTGINVPQINFPGTVNVVPQQVLRDQQVLRLNDILRDVSAANQIGDVRRGDSISLRGFTIDGRDFRKNGFRDPTETPRDFFNVQRVEILKGPASILYGSGQPAGVVNYITKRPQAESYNYGAVQVGTFDLIRTTVDSTGAIDEEGRFLFRVNAAYENTDSFRDFYFGERTFVAPAFTWVVSENTSLTVEYEYGRDRRLFDTGVAAPNNVVGSLPISRFLGEPGDYFHNEDNRVTAWLTSQLADDVWFRIGGYGMWNQNSFADTSVGFFGGFPSSFGPLAPAILATPTTLIRQREDTPTFDNQYYSLIADLAFTAWTGPLEHKVLLGTELGWFRQQFVGNAAAVFGTFFGFPPFTPLAPIDPFNPVYNTPLPPLLPGNALVTEAEQNLYGFYAQDLIDYEGTIQVLAGVRYDIVNSTFGRQSNTELFSPPLSPFLPFPPLTFPFVETETNDYRLTPRVGVVYQPIPQQLAFYGSYTQSFDALPATFTRSITPLKPEIGEAWEGGVKVDLFDGQLSLSAAGFHITKQNVTVIDSLLVASQVGEQRSQGAEATAIGRLTDRWSIIANYAYVDARITDDLNPALVGKQFRNVPYNNANLWTRYDLVSNDYQTFGIAGGIVYVGDRTGDLSATFDLPSYTRFDGGVYFNRGLLRASLYLENLFDREYYLGSVNNASIFPGAPFTVRGSLGVQF